MLVVLRITGLGQHFSAARTWPPKPSRLRCKIGVPSRPTARQKHIPSTCRRQTFGINRIRSLPFHQVASVCSSLNRVRWRKRLVRSISVRCRFRSPVSWATLPSGRFWTRSPAKSPTWSMIMSEFRVLFQSLEFYYSSTQIFLGPKISFHSPVSVFRIPFQLMIFRTLLKSIVKRKIVQIYYGFSPSQNKKLKNLTDLLK